MPELREDLRHLWEAFWRLSSSRSYNMGGPNPISMVDIAAYFTIFEIYDFEEREEFIYLIKELDSAYMKAEANKRKAQGAK